jgi:hypothetical protein
LWLPKTGGWKAGEAAQGGGILWPEAWKESICSMSITLFPTVSHKALCSFTGCKIKVQNCFHGNSVLI